jgi:hypothetical protein
MRRGGGAFLFIETALHLCTCLIYKGLHEFTVKAGTKWKVKNNKDEKWKQELLEGRNY